mmetsp:Transcript_37055/g.66718  ORF Transcript_37055/g.66718 Transcript_37055/m.66718 type:complete len:170 (+) Transcript_37055:49-558(+)
MLQYRLMTITLACLILLHPRLAMGSVGVPEGWRMSDRFIGFRYELTLALSYDEDIKVAIRDKADDLFCFGWVQDSSRQARQTIVGEARCKKLAGHEMKSFLLSLVAQKQVESNEDSYADSINGKQIMFRDYPDTIIRLHFSNFKIVSPGRNTCFRDEPHKCNRLYFEAS